jgi:hypothetical protein
MGDLQCRRREGDLMPVRPHKLAGLGAQGAKGERGPHGPPAPSPLYPVASEVRIAYINAYRNHYLVHKGVATRFGEKLIPRWDGGVGADGRKYSPIWYPIAQIVIKHQVTPEDLVHAAFSTWSDSEPPWPNRLMAEEVIRQAVTISGAEDVGLFLENQRVTWAMEVSRLKRHDGMEQEAAARNAIRNRSLELSPVFRYCMATAAGDEETAGLFAEAAFRQYVYRRNAYDQAWGELIPQALRTRAQDLFNQSRDAACRTS